MQAQQAVLRVQSTDLKQSKERIHSLDHAQTTISAAN
jgi:hypothetical protein